MSKFRTLTAAGVATVALTAGAALTGSVALADGGGDDAAPVTPKQLAVAAKKAPVSNCTGGANTAMVSRTSDLTTVPANSSVTAAGGSWTVRGPKKGSDTVLVTLSGFAYAPSLMYASLDRDGTAVGGQRYFSYQSDYDGASTQFCAKLTKGLHTFDVTLSTGSSAAYLYYPTVTFQRFN